MNSLALSCTVSSSRIAPCPEKKPGNLKLTGGLILLASFAFASSALAAAPGATRQVEIRDPNFNNMVAYTLTIPANWNFQGAVMTGPGCDVDQSIIAYRVWSDDLRYGVQRMPTVSWYTVQDPRTMLGPKCKKMAAMASDEYGRMVAPTLRPGAHITNVSAAPQRASMADNDKKLEAAINANADRLGMPHAKFSSDAQQLRVEYMMGKDAEEEFLQVMEQVSEMPSPTMVSRPGQVLQSQWKMTHKTDAWIVAERAPKGQLDATAPKLEAIRMSLKENPEWDKKVVAWMQDRGAAAERASWAVVGSVLHEGQVQHDALMNQHNDYMNQQRAEATARDRRFHEDIQRKTSNTANQVDYILDQQYYVNPANGQTSTISTTYTNNWQNGAGQQVLTNIQGYDPNGQVSGNWTQLQPISH